MPKPDLEIEEKPVDQTTPPITDNNGDPPVTTTDDENNPAPEPLDTGTSTDESSSDTDLEEGSPDTDSEEGSSDTNSEESSSSTDPENPPPPDPAKGKFGRTFSDPVKPDGDKKKRNEFLKKEYVDTYDKEKEYDEAQSEEEKQKILEQMGKPAPGGGPDPGGNPGGTPAPGNAPAPEGGALTAGGAPAPGGDPGGGPAPGNAPAPADRGIGAKIADSLQSDGLGTAMDITDAASDVTGLGLDINKFVKDTKLNQAKEIAEKDNATEEEKKAYQDAQEASNKAERDANIGSIVTNSVGLITGGIGTYRDVKEAQEAKANGNISDTHSNNLAIAADAFGLGSNAAGVIGSSLGLAGKDENEISGKIGDGLGAVGNILSMSGSADKVRRQNKSLNQLKAITNSDTASAEKKTLAKDYSEATKVKRWGSGFETGAGVANTIASGFSLASDFVGNDTIGAILGIVGTVIGLLGKGLSWFGGKMEDKKKTQNKDSIVDKFVAEETRRVERHGTVEEEGELTDVEKENIAIARMGIDISDFSAENQKEAFKDEIFAHIGDLRVEAARQDTELLSIMGLADNASDEVIRDALGYGE